MLKTQNLAPRRAVEILAQVLLPAAGIGVFGTILWYYLQNTSFWLDEAAVAMNIRTFSFDKIFAPLGNGQYFPRFLLLIIGWLREGLGYKTWVLRVIPLVAAAIATLIWTRLLIRRTPRDLASRFVVAGLLLGSSFWMYYGPQLKQYSTDVLLALIPFLLSDSYFDERFMQGKKRLSILALILPTLFSYTYPIALMGRFLGWALGNFCKHPRATLHSLSFSSFLFLCVSAAAAMGVLWAVDLKYNLATDLTGYWRSCILQARLKDQGAFDGLRLLMNTFWGWQAHLPRPVTAGIAALQGIGLFSIFRNAFRKDEPSRDWGTRSLGSIVTLALLIAASTVYTYPICCGRLTLFTQIHTQLLAVEGLVWIFSAHKNHGFSHRTATMLVLTIGVLSFWGSLKEMIRIATTEPASNLKAMLSDVNPQVSQTLFVSACSVLEVDAMPETFPVKTIVRGERNLIPKGIPVYVLWGHSTASCDQELERMKREAVLWQTVSTGSGRGLVLAVF